MPEAEQPLQLENIANELPSELAPLLEKRDGAARFLQELPKTFSPESVSSKTREQTREQRLWELTGLYYRSRKRYHEALSIFASLYDQMLAAQENTATRVHKQMPLVWISDCHSSLGFPVLAKRYLMLAFCEDAITGEGEVHPDKTGVYFRLVWGHGLPDLELRRYAKQIYERWIRDRAEGLLPEWILQQLDQDWMTEFPAPKEAAVYSANTRYIQYLISKMGESTGEVLERLAEYLLSCMPGCRTTRRQKSRSTDYDIVCSVEGFEVDFRSELGRYFVCECKDWQSPADFTTMAKFCRVLDSTKSRFGILFSKGGISGKGRTAFAEREQLKVFQDRGMVIVVVDQHDLEHVASGGNFVNLLRVKYERVRLDLLDSQETRDDFSH